MPAQDASPPDPAPGRNLAGRRVLLIIAGGIAAYKSLDLIRRLMERGAAVRGILTAGGARFITPLAVSALSRERCHTDMFSLTEESEMGHLRLAQEADLLLVAPATADILARMAAGLADDLATTALLATDRPILVAPAMNHRMWRHPATRQAMSLLEQRGVHRVGPADGPLAEAESGPGRMAEPLEIVAAVEAMLGTGPLSGRRALVTSGPTWEAIDPVRYLGNRSSGKQGHAVATALARLGAAVTLVTGPTAEPDPSGMRVLHVESAREMLAACEAALPADVAVCAAAVADWRPESMAPGKLKKAAGTGAPALRLVENPDILASLARPGPARPGLVIGFAAETERVVEQARAKRLRKGCDWILANDVSAASGVFGGSENAVHLITPSREEAWPRAGKAAIAGRLATEIAAEIAPGAAARPAEEAAAGPGAGSAPGFTP